MKTSNFRSKVSLEKDVPMEWFNYQKDVMESGALGKDDVGASPLDSASGKCRHFDFFSHKHNCLFTVKLTE